MSKTKTKTGPKAGRKPRVALPDALPANAHLGTTGPAPAEGGVPGNADGDAADKHLLDGAKVDAPKAKAASPKAKPETRPVARDGRPKAGDGLPVDLVSGLIGEGSIVAVPYLDGDNVALRLGFVKKLGKTFIDVVVFATADEQHPFRCTDPRNELIAVDPERLDSRVALYEAVKFAAATTRKY